MICLQVSCISLILDISRCHYLKYRQSKKIQEVTWIVFKPLGEETEDPPTKGQYYANGSRDIACGITLDKNVCFTASSSTDWSGSGTWHLRELPLHGTFISSSGSRMKLCWDTLFNFIDTLDIILHLRKMTLFIVGNSRG